MGKFSWQAEDVLAVFKKFDLHPGSSLPVQMLWQNMHDGKAVAAGVEQLVESGCVEVNVAQTNVILTELGYRVIRGETPPPELGSRPSPSQRGILPLEFRRAVILTALEVETRAVLRQLSGIREETVKQTVFHIGQFEGWEIALAECGPGNVRAAVIVERGIDYFSPEVACFIGVAGGVKDVALGDVLVATKVYGYEGGKADAKGFHARPEVSLPAYPFEQRARAIRLKTDWTKRFDGSLDHQAPRIYVGPIAAGEKVVASSRSEVAKFLRENYGDALAVEMEGRGFLDGVYINNPVQGCVVRGISDLLDGKEASDKAGSQAIAADAASAATFEMLATLPLPGASAATPHATPPQTLSARPSFRETPQTSSPAVYFRPGETLAEFGEPYDKVEFTYPDATGFYLRVIPRTALSKPLSRAELRSTIEQAGLFAMWRNPSGLFALNPYGSIVVEPESPAGGALRASSQLFANGEIWGIARWPFVANRPDFGPIIPSKSFEQLYRDLLVRYVNFLSTHLKFKPPLVIKAGSVGLKDFKLAVGTDELYGPYFDNTFEGKYELADFSQGEINRLLLQFFEEFFAASGYSRPANLWNFPPK
jgi:nucleoside phosphorylase